MKWYHASVFLCLTRFTWDDSLWVRPRCKWHCLALFVAEWYSSTSVWHVFIHFSMCEHLGYFHALALINSAAVNTGGACIFWNYGFLWIYPHSSTLAWKIPWTEEPDGLQSMGSLRVDWAIHSLFTFMRWRRKWQPTPVFLPGESRGRGSLVGCRLWGRTELDTTEAT